MYLYQTIGFLTCVLILLPPLFQLVNRRNLADWWHFPIAIVFFIMISSSTTFLRKNDLYVYSFWGLLRDRIAYEEVNYLEVIPARFFLFTGKFNVVIRTASSPSITIPFCEYANWREMVTFLIERLGVENPHFVVPDQLLEKIG